MLFMCPVYILRNISLLHTQVFLTLDVFRISKIFSGMLESFESNVLLLSDFQSRSSKFTLFRFKTYICINIKARSVP